MSASPLNVGITIRATGGAQAVAELTQVNTAITATSTAAAASNRQFAVMAAAMRSAETAAAAINTRLASANAIYDNQVARLTMSTRAYRSYQLQLDGLHPSQIRHIQDLEAAQAATARSSQSMSGLSSVMGAFGVTLGLVGLAGLAKDILDTNRSMESLRAQLLALTGSADQAQQTFNFITQFAVNTPFEIQGLTKAFITLQNYGLTPTTAVMQAITDQSAKLGGRTETLQGITLALGQAWGKGKLQGQEILQMVDQGVPVWDLLAKVTGKNVAELQKMSENGEITRDVIDKLIKKMGEMAAGANAAAMDTLNGKISNLADAWHQFEDALLQSKAEGIIKDIVSSITDTLNILTNQLGSTIDNQIAHAKARIDNFNSMGAVGGFISDLSGYDINAEKNKLDSLNRIKQTQAEAAALKAKTDEIKKANDMQVVASDTTKKGAAELAKLTDTNNKLTLSNHDYVKQQLVSQGVDGDALTKAMALSDANDKLAASHKNVSKETNSGAKEANALASTYENLLATLLKSIALEGDATSTSAMQYDVEKGALSRLTEAKKLSLLQQTAILQNKQLETKASEASKTEMDSLIEKYNQLTLSARDYYSVSLTSKGIAPDKQAPFMAQFDKNASAEISNKKTDDAKQALDAYNKSLDDAHVKTSDLGAVTSAIFDSALGGISAMAGAFDSMANSITANTKALDENAKMQVLNDSTKDPAEKAANVAKYAKEEAKLNNDNIKAQLTGAAQVAGAAASMFDKKSAAAKAFHAIEVTLSIARLAMDAKEIISTLAKIPGNIAAGASAMFASLGPFGFPAVAAMLAVMAAVGFAASGGNGSSSAPPAESPSTGTVLGDKSATSESITKTWDLLKSIHASEYTELRGINAGVSALKTGTESTINRLFQAGGIKDPAIQSDLGMQGGGKIAGIIEMAINAVFNPTTVLTLFGLSKIPVIGGLITGVVDWLNNGLFGGKTKQEISGGGIQTGATSTGQVMSGQSIAGQQYTTVKKTVDGGWFGSDKVSYYDVISSLDAGVTDSLTKVYKAMGKTMLSLASAFGGDLTAQVNATVIPSLRVELRGLSGEDAAKKLNGVISATLDTMATNVFSGILGQYQQLGEGMLETAVRIASEIAVVKDSFAQAGVSLSGNAIDLADSLIQAAGGITAFQTAFQTFYDKFYTDAQKQQRTFTSLTAALTAVYAVPPTTRQGYQNLFTAITQEASDTATKLATFSKADQTGTVAGLAATQAAKLAQDRYAAMLANASLADAYYTALDTSIKKLNDAVATAKSNLLSAYKSESDVLTGIVTKVSSFTDALKKFRDTLTTGALSTASAAQKEALLRQKFNSVSDVITAGPGTTDVSRTAYGDAVNALPSAAQDFLTSAMANSKSAAEYARDYAQVMNMVNTGITQTEAAKTVAEQSLDTLKTQVSGLVDINTSVLSVKDAIVNLNLANKAASDATTALDTQFTTATSTNTANLQQAGINSTTANAAAVLAQRQTAYDKLANLFTLSSARQFILNSGNKSPGDAAQQQGIQEAAQYMSGWLTKFDPTISAATYAQITQNVIDGMNQGYSPAYNGSVSNAGAQAVGDKYYGQSMALINGSHANGLHYVPYDGYLAELHKGERVLTATEALSYQPPAVSPAIAKSNSATPSDKSYQELIAEIKQLRADLKTGQKDMQTGQTKVVKATEETALQLRRWEGNGMPAVRL